MTFHDSASQLPGGVLTQETWRLLDANVNRCMEGLRTLEDVARFVLNDFALSRSWKDLRHSLREIASRWPRSELLAARDAITDVGRMIKTKPESHRDGFAEIVAAAAGRCQESLRLLGEVAKVFDSQAACELENLRYDCYSLAAHQEGRLNRRLRLADARLYVLIDCQRDAEDFENHVRRLFEMGADVIQLRDKIAVDSVLYDRAVRAAKVAKTADGIFIVNDRMDVAVAANADGVHLGQTELPAAIARKLVGGRMLVGISTHSIDQAREAVESGADYIGCGPTFGSTTKEFATFSGLNYLREIAEEDTVPAFAVGGIDLDNLADVLATGMRRIAVAGAVANSAEPYDAVKRIAAALKQSTFHS